MKVIFLVSHLQSGGAERTVSYLSSYLAEYETDVMILSLTDNIFYEINPRVKVEKLHINRESNNLFGRFFAAIERMIKVNISLLKYKPDVVFCMLPDTAKYLLGLHRRRKFKLITSERINPEIYKGSSALKLKEKIYSESDGIVFQTQRAMDFYPKEIQKKSIVIHNAIGNEYVYQVPEINERKKKVTAIGRLSDQKDYPTLLEAFREVLKQHPEYTLEIFGNGPDKDKLKQLSEELGIGSSVYFMGAHKDAIVQAADSACYVMSSKYEGMPNALMEAMAVGLPCVSTDCPNGPAELITSGVNGVLVPVGDAQALSEAILRMIEDRDFAEKCGANARKILETHNINIKAKEYMEYILKIYSEV